MQKKRRKAKLKRGMCLVVHGPKVWDGTSWQPNALLVCSMKSGEIRMKRISDEQATEEISEGSADLHEAHEGLHESPPPEEQPAPQEGSAPPGGELPEG